MVIAIVGASGFLGTNLITRLLLTTEHEIRAISRHASAIDIPDTHRPRVILIEADVRDEAQLIKALSGVDIVYYFVHMMGQADRDFYAAEASAAYRLSAAVTASSVPRVIFMGGLGNDHEDLSAHLASRHNTGTILRENCPLVLEFRASMIIGKGSISFDIIKHLVHKLPVMTLPRWCITKTQPIALPDALDYLVAAADVALPSSRIVEIGGPDVVSYQQLYKLYANSIGRHPLLVRVPFLPEWLGGWWLNLFTPKGHAKIGRVMVHSMSNAMVVTDNSAKVLFPNIIPRSITDALHDAR